MTTPPRGSPPETVVESILYQSGGKRSQLLTHIQFHELGDGVVALERAGVCAVVEHGTESLFVQRVVVLFGEMGAKLEAARASSVSPIALSPAYLAAMASEEGSRGDSIT